MAYLVRARRALAVSLASLALLSSAPLVAEGEEFPRESFVDDETFEAYRLVKAVVEARFATKCGYARFTSEDPTGREIYHEAWFKDGDKFRVDLPGRKRSQTGDDAFMWTIPSDGRFVSPERRETDDEVNRAFDFRLLGLCIETTTGITSKHLDHFVIRPEHGHRARVVETTHDGRAVKLVTTEVDDGRVFRYWIDTERGPSLVRGECLSVQKNKTFVDTLTVSLHDYGGTWFPKEVVFTRRVDVPGSLASLIGLNPRSSYVTRIEHAEFDREIEDHVFTLAGFGVPPWTNVRDVPAFPEGKRIWDGENIVVKDPNFRRPAAVPDARTVTREATTPQQNPSWRVLIRITIITTAACLAAIAFVRRWFNARS